MSLTTVPAGHTWTRDATAWPAWVRTKWRSSPPLRRGRGGRDPRDRASAGRRGSHRAKQSSAILSSTSAGVPATPLRRSSSGSRPIAWARRATSASSPPQQSTWATDLRSVAGSRPIASQAASVRSIIGRVSAGAAKGTFSSVANRAARVGVRRGPCPPTITGGCGFWSGLGRAGLSTSW